jgi:hypothetical protein
LQLAQIAALFEAQLDPAAATPFEQVQMLAWQLFPFRLQPVLQLPQIPALLVVQFSPVAAIPVEQVQVLALHAVLESI